MSSLAREIAKRAETAPCDLVFRFLERGETEKIALSYAELDRLAKALATPLLECSRSGGGDRALLLFEPGHEFVEALVACLYAGVIAIPAPAPRPGMSFERLELIAANSSAGILLTSVSIQQSLAARAETGSAIAGMQIIATDALDRSAPPSRLPGFDSAPDAPAIIQYTSGSTLDPKGVVLTSACALANIEYTCTGMGFGRNGPETFVNWMPHYHDMALIGKVLIPLVMGFEAVHMDPRAFVQKPSRWLQAISRYGGTSSGGPPVAYDMCVDRIPPDVVEELDLSTWNVAFCGAEPVFNSTLTRFRDRFASAGFRRRNLFSVYGLAELTLYACGSPPPADEDEPLEPLQRSPCYLNAEARAAIRIVSESRTVVSDGAEGEIWISHPSVAAGYLEDRDQTARTFDQRLDPDDGRTYLRTGDLGMISGTSLRVTGRSKDVLIQYGLNVAAADVERVATEGRSQLNCNGAAAFQCDNRRGPIVLLLEKQRRALNALTEADLMKSIRKDLSDRLNISVSEILFLKPGALPRTTSGKIQRDKARRGWLHSQQSNVGSAS